MSLLIHPRLLLGGFAGSWREGCSGLSDRALLESPLKQHHCFRDVDKDKFPLSTVCEQAGPDEGGICQLWRLGDAVGAVPAHQGEAPDPCPPSTATSSCRPAETTPQAPFLTHLLSFIFKSEHKWRQFVRSAQARLLLQSNHREGVLFLK